MTILGIISSALLIIATLLKYYPQWRKDHAAHGAREEAGRFGQELADGDDVGASVRLSDEFDRVRRESDGPSG